MFGCAAQLAPVDEISDIPNAILGCQDRHVRVIQKSELFYEASLPAAVQVLNHMKSKKGPQQIIYGMQNGVVGLMSMDSERIAKGWIIPNAKKAGAVSTLNSQFDFTADGVNDVVVGREDGTVEVYSFDVSAEPRLVFS